MKASLSTLDNNLDVLVVPMPQLESATITVWSGVGSRYEGENMAGLSHFLEHIFFKGSKMRPSARAISEAIDGIGGEVNAGTGKEWTNFYIKAQKGSLPVAFDVLSDMLLHPLIKESDIEKEKGVILEEMAMYEDTPRIKIWDVFENLIYAGNTLARDIIGSKKTVKSLSRKDFSSYLDKYYYGENLLITVSGGINEKDVLNLAKKYFSSLKSEGSKKFDRYISNQPAPRVLLRSKKSDQAHLVMGFLGNPYGHEDRFSESVLSAILGGGMSSRLFTEVREKRGLAYSVNSSVDHALDTGYFCANAGVDIKRIDEAVKVILDEFYKLTDHQSQITNNELNKAKEYVKGHLALSLEDTKNVNRFFGVRKLMIDKIQTPDEVMKKIDQITKKDITNLAKRLFVKNTLNLAIIGPYKDKTRFEKLIS